MFSNQIRLPAFFSKCASRKHFDNPTSTFIYRLDIPASTFYSAPPNSGILLTLRSTIGCCSCLHATTYFLSSPIHHLYQNLSRNVNTFIVQTPDGHDQDREITGSSVVNTSWRPANERWPFSDAEKRAASLWDYYHPSWQWMSTYIKSNEKKTNAAKCE